jgi:hypothetical protein
VFNRRVPRTKTYTIYPPEYMLYAALTAEGKKRLSPLRPEAIQFFAGVEGNKGGVKGETISAFGDLPIRRGILDDPDLFGGGYSSETEQKSMETMEVPSYAESGFEPLGSFSGGKKGISEIIRDGYSGLVEDYERGRAQNRSSRERIKANQPPPKPIELPIEIVLKSSRTGLGEKSDDRNKFQNLTRIEILSNRRLLPKDPPYPDIPLLPSPPLAAASRGKVRITVTRSDRFYNLQRILKSYQSQRKKFNELEIQNNAVFASYKILQLAFSYLVEDLEKEFQLSFELQKQTTHEFSNGTKPIRSYFPVLNQGESLLVRYLPFPFAFNLSETASFKDEKLNSSPEVFSKLNRLRDFLQSPMGADLTNFISWNRACAMNEDPNCKLDYFDILNSMGLDRLAETIGLPEFDPIERMIFDIIFRRSRSGLFDEMRGTNYGKERATGLGLKKNASVNFGKIQGIYKLLGDFEQEAIFDATLNLGDFLKEYENANKEKRKSLFSVLVGNSITEVNDADVSGVSDVLNRIALLLSSPKMKKTPPQDCKPINNLPLTGIQIGIFWHENNIPVCDADQKPIQSNVSSRNKKRFKKDQDLSVLTYSRIKEELETEHFLKQLPPMVFIELSALSGGGLGRWHDGYVDLLNGSSCDELVVDCKLLALLLQNNIVSDRLEPGSSVRLTPETRNTLRLLNSYIENTLAPALR